MLALTQGCGEIRLGRDACWACNESIGLAPPPETVSEALIHVYEARTYRWHGIFAVHTWIALKPRDAQALHRYASHPSVALSLCLSSTDRE